MADNFSKIYYNKYLYILYSNASPKQAFKSNFPRWMQHSDKFIRNSAFNYAKQVFGIRIFQRSDLLERLAGCNLISRMIFHIISLYSKLLRFTENWFFSICTIIQFILLGVLFGHASVSWSWHGLLLGWLLTTRDNVVYSQQQNGSLKQVQYFKFYYPLCHQWHYVKLILVSWLCN